MELVIINKEIEVAKTEFGAYVEETQRLCSDALEITVTNDESAQYAITLGGAAKAIVKDVEARRKKTIANATAFIDEINSLCKTITEPLKQAEAATKKKAGDYQIAVEAERLRQADLLRKAAKELQDKLDCEAKEAREKAAKEGREKAEEEIRLRREKEVAEESIRLKAETNRRQMIAFENETPEEELAAEAKRLAAEKAIADEANATALEAEIAAACKAAEETANAAALKAPIVLAPVIAPAQPVRTASGITSYQVKSWKFEIVNAAIVPPDFQSPDEKKIKDSIDTGVRDIPGVNIYEHTETRFRNSSR